MVFKFSCSLVPALKGIPRLLASPLVSCRYELMDVDVWGLFSLFVCFCVCLYGDRAI